MSVRRLFDGYGSRLGNVRDNDRGLDVLGIVRLNLIELSEDEIVELFVKVLNYVVLFRFVVDEEVKIVFFLEVNDSFNFVFYSFFVFFLGDFIFVEFGMGNLDFFGLGERIDGGGGEFGEVEVFFLGFMMGRERRFLFELFFGDGSNLVMDSRVRGLFEFLLGSNVFGVLFEGGIFGIVKSLGKGGNFFIFFFGERELV